MLPGPVPLREAQVRDGNPHSRSFEDLKAFLWHSAVPRLVPVPYRAQHTSDLGASEAEK